MEYSIRERFRNLNRALRYYHDQERDCGKLEGWELLKASVWLNRRQAILEARIKQLRKDEGKMLIEEIRKPLLEQTLVVYLTKRSKRFRTKFRSKKDEI